MLPQAPSERPKRKRTRPAAEVQSRTAESEEYEQTAEGQYERVDPTPAAEDLEHIDLAAWGILLPSQLPGGITPQLADLLARAALITAGSDESFTWSFSSILLAFLASPEPVSVWFQTYVKWAQILVDLILSHKKVTLTRLADVRSRILEENEIREMLARGRQLGWTDSAQTMLNEAETLMERTSGRRDGPLDVRHLMGAYIYRPRVHDSQLKEWGFNREDWGSAFLDFLFSRFREEAWVTIHLETFHRGPQLPYPMPLPNAEANEEIGSQGRRASHVPQGPAEESRTEPQTGPSTHVARDRWTVNDSLRYFPYAYAIYRFLVDEQTKPPLAISIQAPWGGGKTSLMRMIQHQLDPDAVDSFERPGNEGLKKAKVKDVLRELDQQQDAGAGDGTTSRAPQLPSLKGGAERRVTVWFNAWKYESTSQVWAGLADSIVRQVGNRLGPVERELFWFRLQLRRIDAGKVRRKVHEQLVTLITERVLPWLWAYAVVPVGLPLLAFLSRSVAPKLWEHVGWITGAAFVGDVVAFSKQANAAKSEIDEKPARASLARRVC